MDEPPRAKRPYRYKVKPKTPALSAADRVFCTELVKNNDRFAAVALSDPHSAGNEKEMDRLSRNYMARKPIKRELERLKAQASAMSSFDVAQAMEAFLEIYRADPNDLVSVRVGCCRYCNGIGHRYQWNDREYAEAIRQVMADRAAWRGKGRTPEQQYPDPDTAGGFGFLAHEPPHPDCPECGGEGVPRVVACDTRTLYAKAHPLYAGVRLTKYGPEIILHDKVKALENVVRMMGGFDDRVRLRAEVSMASVNVNFDTTDPNIAAESYKRMMDAGRG